MNRPQSRTRLEDEARLSQLSRRVGRIAALSALAVLLLGGLGGWWGCCALSGPCYSGPPSSHFDGKRFSNLKPSEHGSLWKLLRWRFGRRQVGPWRSWVDATPGPRPPRRVFRGELRITFVNHATTLIQVDGINVLTDPIWSDRASPLTWAGPKRVRPPGIRFEDLPPIDYVLVSHNHYDHLDLATIKRLVERHHCRVVVGLGNARLLSDYGVPGAVEMDWWQGYKLKNGSALHAVPAQHLSMRGLCDRNATLWAGYVIRGRAGAVYFAGDTAMGPHFAEIGRRFGPLRLALLPIGAFRPRWFMKTAHISPGEAIAAHRQLRARTSVAIHFGTFPLADDGETEPADRLRRLLRQQAAPQPRFWVLGFGEGRQVP